MKKISLIFAVCSIFAVSACVDNNNTDTPYNQQDFSQGGEDAPLMNERTSGFMQPNNEYAKTDASKPIDETAKAESNNKWNTSKLETRWQEYKGTMVRVQILFGNTDLREMRLRLMQNANGGDIDGDARTVLGKVADFEMKKVCGRNAESYMIVYDKPSFQVMRPTPYFDYRVESDGVTMREYGFRCIYNTQD